MDGVWLNYNNAVRGRLKYINLHNTKNTIEFEKSGLISLRFLTHVLACRHMTPPTLPGYIVDDEEILSWEYQWYGKYLHAIYQIYLTIQKASKENRLIIRDAPTETSIQINSISNLQHIDIKDEFTFRIEEFNQCIFPNTWPDMIFMPDGGAYAKDIISWANLEGIASTKEMLEMLKLSNNHGSAQDKNEQNSVSLDDQKKQTAWVLKPADDLRHQGYRWPLYQFLKKAQNDGVLTCPGAWHVINAWKTSPPEEFKIVDDELRYKASNGKPRSADVKAIQAAIKNLLL